MAICQNWVVNDFRCYRAPSGLASTVLKIFMSYIQKQHCWFKDRTFETVAHMRESYKTNFVEKLMATNLITDVLVRWFIVFQISAKIHSFKYVLYNLFLSLSIKQHTFFYKIYLTYITIMWLFYTILIITNELRITLLLHMNLN